jgi:hypothetical protein
MSEKIRVTGLWKNTSKNGGTYLKGSLSPVTPVLIMPNDYKKGEKDPDFFLYFTENQRKEKPQEQPAGDPF